jgi:hypothetical protein
MTVSDKDLFLAILAMDSYNRGYNAGIEDGDVSDRNGLGDSVGTQIGTATITLASDSRPISPEVAAGFYAVAYQTQYGTVISYRGTDNLAVFGPDAAASDVYGGCRSPHPFVPSTEGSA